MTILVEKTTPPCASVPEVYDDEQLHSPPARTDISAAQWEQLNVKRASAHRQCAGCPVLVDCLYRAVVEVDVSGFAACTTEADRQNIRRQLGIQVHQSSTTPYGAPRVGGGPVNHDSVMNARHSYPKDTCHQLAERLGCSTSTVKRHLRRAREAKLEQATAAATAAAMVPTVEAVLDAFDTLETSKIA